jgi:hypothetical protein
LDAFGGSRTGLPLQSFFVSQKKDFRLHPLHSLFQIQAFNFRYTLYCVSDYASSRAGTDGEILLPDTERSRSAAKDEHDSAVLATELIEVLCGDAQIKL